jgi:hypothetical protein
MTSKRQGRYLTRARVAAVCGVAVAAVLIDSPPSSAWREVSVPDAVGDVQVLDPPYDGDWTHSVPAPHATIGDIVAVRDRYADKQLRLRVRTAGLRDDADSLVVLTAHLATRTQRQRLTWDIGRGFGSSRLGCWQLEGGVPVRRRERMGVSGRPGRAG